MRVVAGIYRGRKLASPDFDGVRPTTDRVKESLFDIVQGCVRGATVLDLFAGSGALGIEAVSRGAEKVYFCDNNNRSVALLKQNLSFVPQEKYEIIKSDYSDALRTMANRGIKFDLVLCDPPYALKLGGEIVKLLYKYNLLNRGATVTVEHNWFDEPINGASLDVQSVRKYGEIGLTVMKNVTKVAVTGTFDPITLGHKDLVEKALRCFDKVYVVALVNPDKTMKYPLEERLEMMKTSLSEYGKRVQIDHYEGLTVDYCKQNGIKYILRGIRNTTDVDYERQIAEYNYVNGGVKTLYMPALHSEISSTLVRRQLEDGLEVDGLVDDAVKPMLTEDKNNGRH